MDVDCRCSVMLFFQTCLLLTFMWFLWMVVTGGGRLGYLMVNKMLHFSLTWFFTDKSKPYSSIQMPHVSLHNFQRPKTSLDQQPLISSWFSKTFPPLNFYFDILFCPLVLKVPTGFPGVLKTNVICCFVKTPKMFVFKFLQIRIWIFFAEPKKSCL